MTPTGPLLYSTGILGEINKTFTGAGSSPPPPEKGARYEFRTLAKLNFSVVSTANQPVYSPVSASDTSVGLIALSSSIDLRCTNACWLCDVECRWERGGVRERESASAGE